MNPNINNAFVLPYGAFSHSGYGDGEYIVFTKERTAFAIRFIDDGKNENIFYADQPFYF